MVLSVASRELFERLTERKERSEGYVCSGAGCWNHVT